MITRAITFETLQNRIFSFRDEPVMLDRDLAYLYGVQTKALNQAVQRNIDRFPEGFSFRLTADEKDELVTICDRFKSLKHSNVCPRAFTEQGVAMLSAILRSETAVKVSIQIMQAFVKMRRLTLNNASLFERMNRIEKQHHSLTRETSTKFELVFKALESKKIDAEQGIFFDGEVYDAYVFVSSLIRKAKSSIILIDNYIDETVLTLLTKRAENVSVTVYARKVDNRLQLDLDRHNSQYPMIEIVEMSSSHDRFLFLDQSELYHFGASLKDLGKKWFAFSRMDDLAELLLRRLP